MHHRLKSSASLISFLTSRALSMTNMTAVRQRNTLTTFHSYQTSTDQSHTTAAWRKKTQTELQWLDRDVCDGCTAHPTLAHWGYYMAFCPNTPTGTHWLHYAFVVNWYQHSTNSLRLLHGFLSQHSYRNTLAAWRLCGELVPTQYKLTGTNTVQTHQHSTN